MGMAESRVAARLEAQQWKTADNPRTVTDPSAIQRVLFVLEDEDSRAILDETSGTALSANEVSETCGLPLSTAYRKLHQLTDTGLLEERTRLRRNGKHASEYIRRFENVVITPSDDGGMVLRIQERTPPERPAPFTN